MITQNVYSKLSSSSSSSYLLLIILLSYLDSFVNCSFYEDACSPVWTESGLAAPKTTIYRGKVICKFFCIPYAKYEPWEKPQPPDSWEGVRNFTKFGKACPQVGSGAVPRNRQDPDCLCLNVYTTKSACHQPSKLPVMLYYHGGYFKWGTPHQKELDGSALAAQEGVVTVHCSYRLWAYGFFHYPEAGIQGNLGLYDQLSCMKWVKSNIAMFGGNPEAVTIAGHGAGAVSVSIHVCSPLSRGYFHNVILNGGSGLGMEHYYDPKANKLFVEAMGCDKASNVLECLKNSKVDPRDNATLRDVQFYPRHGTQFLPHSLEICMSNGNYEKHLNFLIGVNENHGAAHLTHREPKLFDPLKTPNLDYQTACHILGEFFGHSKKTKDFYCSKYLSPFADCSSLLEGIIKAQTDVNFFCPAVMFGYYISKFTQGLICAYKMDYKPCDVINPKSAVSPWYGATEDDDLLLTFGHHMITGYDSCCDDIITSLQLLHVWAYFAHNGKPPLIAGFDWPCCRRNWFGDMDCVAAYINPSSLDRLDRDGVKFCEKAWPFPIDGPYFIEKRIELPKNLTKN